ncbi:hypothetical protein CDAR_444161 [Caerostris darwini]|uniref:Uncharacterized protein n=1 Tax=Caerostris darwini TaxID=1538125 RepID=A0AAV4X9M1_9ARAC|nr:hypothetical protein CDAR_444161 [Caerostris darwini]
MEEKQMTGRREIAKPPKTLQPTEHIKKQQQNSKIPNSYSPEPLPDSNIFEIQEVLVERKYFVRRFALAAKPHLNRGGGELTLFRRDRLVRSLERCPPSEPNRQCCDASALCGGQSRVLSQVLNVSWGKSLCFAFPMSGRINRYFSMIPKTIFCNI